MSRGRAAVGLFVNPMSGRDVRRLAARASTTTLEIKRDQVARAAVGAVAGGAERLVVIREPFRIATSAVENLSLHAEIEVLDIGAELRASDSQRGAGALEDAGCLVVVVLGGDGTNRAIARAGCPLPVIPLSTGTNNAFPVSVEATSAGVAAGLVASGRVPPEDVVAPAKVVRVEIEGEADDLALIDAVLMVDDSVGNLMPFDPSRIRRVVLSRADPAAVGSSPIGGFLHPCSAEDEFGVEVVCTPEGDGGRALLVPISPGLFRPVYVKAARRLEFGERVEMRGPGVLAFDGDRERSLADGQVATLCVERNGPRVIDVQAVLERAAREGLFLDRTHWHDSIDDALGVDCC